MILSNLELPICTLLIEGTQRENSVLSANLRILAGMVVQRWGKGRMFRGNIYA